MRNLEYIDRATREEVTVTYTHHHHHQEGKEVIMMMTLESGAGKSLKQVWVLHHDLIRMMLLYNGYVCIYICMYVCMYVCMFHMGMIGRRG